MFHFPLENSIDETQSDLCVKIGNTFFDYRRFLKPGYAEMLLLKYRYLDPAEKNSGYKRNFRNKLVLTAFTGISNSKNQKACIKKQDSLRQFLMFVDGENFVMTSKNFCTYLDILYRQIDHQCSEWCIKEGGAFTKSKGSVSFST